MPSRSNCSTSAQTTLARVDLIPLEDDRALAVLVTDAGWVTARAVTLEPPLGHDEVRAIGRELNGADLSQSELMIFGPGERTPEILSSSRIGLSKATVSHHIFQLRQAGLITERRVGRTGELAIRLDPVRSLSRALARDLNGRRSS